MTKISKKALFRYFSGQSNDLQMDIDHVDGLIRDGADINYKDKSGHTVLHEVAERWPIDAARFLLKQGAMVDAADRYGRTPLHLAAAADRAKMVELLIKSGADKEAVSTGELHTPVHFAARNDACQSLVMLIELGCQYMDVRDYKKRTPLHLAAQLDRTVAARYLLEKGAPASVTDQSGIAAITWMIAKMPQVACRGLSQFHLVDIQNRKQHTTLKQLTPEKSGGTNHSPFQVAVHYNQFKVLAHPAISKLLDVMWKRFGMMHVWMDFILNLVYIILWTVQGVLVEYDRRHYYVLPAEWWRIVLFLTAIGFTVWQIVEEFQEYYRSKRAHKLWVEWRREDIKQDMEFCHPRWPNEKEFLERELSDLNRKPPTYFEDRWNIFDWVCYVLLLSCVITHLADVISHSDLLARWHIRVMCVTIILLWLRLMKCARAFTLVGPFIVMLGHMMTDLLRFLFLYLQFYIPFVCAFWMIYGGDKTTEDGSDTVEVEGYENFGVVFFSLFQLSLVDEYDFQNMKEVDSVMTYILLASWFALSAILCLNLFIALLTNTFQTIYDNAKDNAMMQKAITILTIWDGLSRKRQETFLEYINTHCSPLVEYYDDDVTKRGEDLRKVTMQIRNQINEMQENWKEKFGDKETAKMEQTMDRTELPKDRVLTNGHFNTGLYRLQMTIEDVNQRQDSFISSYRKDMKNILQQLNFLMQNTPRRLDYGFEKPNSPRADNPQLDQVSDETEHKRRKKKKRKKVKSVGLLNLDIAPQIDEESP